MNKSLQKYDDTYNNNPTEQKVRDEDYEKYAKDPKLKNWKSQQIAGILTIIFFGFIAILYILFINTYKGKEETTTTEPKIKLIDFIKTPLLLFCSLSFLIISVILSNGFTDFNKIEFFVSISLLGLFILLLIADLFGIKIDFITIFTKYIYDTIIYWYSLIRKTFVFIFYTLLFETIMNIYKYFQ
jgi:membrane-associated HD superfamily phosphohydrolase